jgi:outer membrane protein assembly factor BamA
VLGLDISFLVGVNMLCGKRCKYWVLSVLFCVAASQSGARDSDTTETAPKKEQSSETVKFGFDAGSVIVVPVPINDPTFGTGLALGGGYFFQADEGSDTSFLGGGLFGTTDDSYAAGIGGSYSFDYNRYNIVALFGAADINYDLYLAGRPVPIEQDGAAFQAEFSYGFSDTFSAGVSLRYLQSKVAGLGGSALPAEIANLTDVSIGTVGILAKRDTRDDTYYPTSGNNMDLSLTYSEEVGGAALNYGHGTLGYNHFWSLSDRSVVGLRAAGCWIEDHAPFYDSCLLGSELRGFSLFEFYGSSMLTAQAEFRRRISKRFGYVAFAGLGDVQKNLTSNDSGVRYSGGLGLRIRVSEEFSLDFSIDGTLNDKNESSVYFYAGQFF